MSIDLLKQTPQGDKRNSTFFEDYRLKIYERRLSLGLDQLIGNLRALIVQVETADGLPYLSELALMTPYRLIACYISSTHRIFVLASKPAFPRLIVMEPLAESYEDEIKQLNMLYPLARRKPNSRYVGEVFHTKDLSCTQELLERCNGPGDCKNSLYSLANLRFSTPSDFTHNRVGYSQMPLEDPDE